MAKEKRDRSSPLIFFFCLFITRMRPMEIPPSSVDAMKKGVGRNSDRHNSLAALSSSTSALRSSSRSRRSRSSHSHASLPGASLILSQY